MDKALLDQVARSPRQMGEALRRARRSKALTQKELAEKMDVRQATISQLEDGGSQVRTLMDALAALGLELVIRPRRQGTDAHDIEDLF